MSNVYCLALHWQDHAVIVAYLLGMILFGAYLSRRQNSDEEYFLAGRRMPWFAVGISVIASLLSSLTYLSEPGEVWNSGITHIFGKMLAIPFEMLLVWLFIIPFMMRFRYTSAYEYLGDRFGVAARRFGAGLFILMVVLWMGFVVLASARALEAVSGMSLFTIIATVGIVATIYTVLGGLRAVIWTDVVQVGLLIGGGLFTIFYVAINTNSGLGDWYGAAVEHLGQAETRHSVPFFSFDPRVRATVVTVALNMLIWHLCTHTANQMTVQRYYSTSDAKAARRSFVTGSLFGVGLNLMLMVAGLAVLFYYFGQQLPIDNGLDPAIKQHRDLIFPTFAVNRLPPGLGGAILAALLAAAMSSIDSGINSIATVVTVERQAGRRTGKGESAGADHVGAAKGITLAAGTFITLAAYGLDYLPGQWGIVDAMPRTFNAVTAPLGGLFLVGIFLPRVGQAAAIAGCLAGLVTSVLLGYSEQVGQWLHAQQWITSPWPGLSFTWIMPSALAVTFAVAFAMSLILPRPGPLEGLTWFSRKSPPPR